MKTQKKKVVVIGLWHLGCTVAASLVEAGYSVIGLDFNERLITELRIGKLPLYEPGLNELTNKHLKTGNLDFSGDFKVIKEANYVVVAQDIPVNKDDKVDLEIIFKIARAIKKYTKPGTTVIIMSQVPVGTSRKIYSILGGKIEVIYNPENLRLGEAIKTFLNADRMIIGTSSKNGVAKMKKFYSFFKNPLIFMSLESAEMVKHGINTFLACSISLTNQITAIAEAVKANMNDVSMGMRSDPRIGSKARILPGLGFAGGTLGRDVQVLRQKADEYNIKVPLIADIYKVNREQIEVVAEKIKKILGNDIKGKKIAILGLTYKPGTSTLRRSFSLEVISLIKKQGALVSVFDPGVKEPTKETVGLVLASDPYEATSKADILVILTEWEEFKELNFQAIKKTMNKAVLYDAKNMLNTEKMRKLGFDYYGTGIVNESF